MTLYGTILDSSPDAITRLVVADGGLTLQTLTLTHEVTLPEEAVDVLLAALRQEAQAALPPERLAASHWARWPGLAACGSITNLLVELPQDATCTACLDVWLQQGRPEEYEEQEPREGYQSRPIGGV